MTAAQVEALALEALLEEVRATPKPGLVDLWDSGAHRDMDVDTFGTSAKTIAPFLGQMFAEGAASTAAPQVLFSRIRPIGQTAEEAMLAATGGVNTHKGAIFTLGLLSAAAGQASRYGAVCPVDILARCREMAAEPLRAELAAMAERPPRTHGERLYLATGSAGIRGEAIAGFPALLHIALPALKEASQPDWNRQLLYTLLRLMEQVEDSTVLHRGGTEGLCWMRREAGSFLSAYPVLTDDALKALSNLNDAFIRRNLSPGGCADLLCAAVFLCRLEESDHKASHLPDKESISSMLQPCVS